MAMAMAEWPIGIIESDGKGPMELRWGADGVIRGYYLADVARAPEELYEGREIKTLAQARREIRASYRLPVLGWNLRMYSAR